MGMSGITCPRCGNTTDDDQNVADKWCPWCVDYTHGTLPDWLIEYQRAHRTGEDS